MSRFLYSLFVVLSIAVCVHAACKLTGVNQAGAEGGKPVPGRLNWEYVYPKVTADYFVKKGMNVFRLPFLWERMIQPTIGSNFSAMDIATYIDSLNYMTKSAYVIIDPHNYGGGFGGKIGESSTTIQHFADFWAKMATVFKSNPRVIYGLMNEPKDNDIYVWREACQAAVTAIRGTGATQTILVPGIGFTGAHSWISTGSGEVMWDIRDPLNNYAYEVHQYLDVQSSGQDPVCYSSTFGSKALRQFTEWARAYNKMGFLGEFGGSNSKVCLEAIDDIITYMDQNTDVWLGWTYWAAGPFWGECWCSLQPNSTVADREEWASVAPHLASSVPSTLVVGKTTPPGPVYISIYKDGLTNGWGDYGWAPHNDGNTTMKHTGTSSISFTVSNGNNLAYAVNGRLNTTSYTYIQFWIYVTSGSTDNIAISMATLVDGSPHAVGPNLKLTSLLSVPFSANTWLQVTVPLANYTSQKVYDGFEIMGSGSGFIDDIYQVKYVYGSSPTNPVATSASATSSATASSSGTSSASVSGSSASASVTSSKTSATSASASGSSSKTSASSASSAASAPGGSTTTPNQNNDANGPFKIALGALIVSVLFVLLL